MKTLRMGHLAKLWAPLTFVILCLLSSVEPASVSSREDQEPATSANIATEPPLADDNEEASVEDVPPHFFYHGNQAGLKDHQRGVEKSDHEDEGDLNEVKDRGFNLEPSIEDTLMGMFDDYPSSSAQGYYPVMPQYHAPFEGSLIGSSLPGYSARFASRLVPIDMPIRQELVQEIIGNGDQESYGGKDCSHCPCRSQDFSIPDGFVFDPIVAYQESHRWKRSAGDDDYWYKLNDPSEHLEKYNVNYRIQNDLRRRVEEDSPPLHYGHIYTGNIGHYGDYNTRDRAFGLDADFNFPHDVNAFKWKPHGPRLNTEWAKHNYPIFSHNLYKLREQINAMEFGIGGKGKKVKIQGGVYKFVSVTKQGDVLLTNVKTHQRFLIPRFFTSPNERKKFQALGPWRDPNGLYFPVSADVLGGEAYIIKGTPLTGNDPKLGNHLVYNGIPLYPPPPPTNLLSREKGKKLLKGLKVLNKD